MITRRLQRSGWLAETLRAALLAPPLPPLPEQMEAALGVPTEPSEFCSTGNGNPAWRGYLPAAYDPERALLTEKPRLEVDTDFAAKVVECSVA